MTPTLKIESENNGERLDVVLARAYPKYSRSFLQKVVKKGGVTLRGEPTVINYRVHAGEIYDIADFETPSPYPHPRGRGPTAGTPSKKDVGLLPPGEGGRRPDEGSSVPAILFEDASLLVLNKPAGLVVHPAAGHHGDTLIDWLRVHLGTAISNRFVDSERLGLVHRLDKDTSGLLLVAKSVEAQTALSRQFRDRTISKTYSAFVEGILASPQGVISAPVARSRKNPARMAVANYGRAAETTFQVNEAYKEVSVSQLTLFPKTGRTHQIRVHMSAIGHPIIGDKTYGSKTIWNESYQVRRSLLHAEKLEFRHPDTEKTVSFQAPWPKDFLSAQKLFRKGLALILTAVVLGVPASRLRADTSAGASAAPAAAATPAPVHTHHTSSSSSGSSTSSAVRALKKEVAAMKEQLDALKEQLSALQNSYEQLSAGSRLSDLEHAVSELNAKAVAGTTGAEETKTQAMDTGRKVKDLGESMSQMRDQIDRMQP